VCGVASIAKTWHSGYLPYHCNSRPHCLLDLRLRAFFAVNRHRTGQTPRRLQACSASLRDDAGSVPSVVVDEDRISSNGRAAYSGNSLEQTENAESVKRQELFNQIAPMYDQVHQRTAYSDFVHLEMACYMYADSGTVQVAGCSSCCICLCQPCSVSASSSKG
jgi:hypothetical protein